MSFAQCTMTSLPIALIGFLLPAAAQEVAAVKVVVQEGQNVVNVLASNSAVSPVVEVRDKNDKAVAGARVTFVLPKEGPRAVFAGGKNSVSVSTGNDGRAKSAVMHPLGVGKFEIAVQADYKGQTATSTVTQVNVETVADAEAARTRFFGQQTSAALKIEILEGDDGVNIIDKGTAVKSVVKITDKNNLPVAGVAVAFAVVAMRGGSKAEFSNNKSTITVTTDSAGIAVADELRPSGTGPFRVQVQVNAYGQIVTRTVTQTNYPTELAALNAGKMPGSSRGDATTTGQSGNEVAKVKVVNGENGQNVIKDNSGVGPAVEVDDAAGNPVPGVEVAFILPADGKLAQFPGGATYVIVTTNASGQAATPNLRPIGKGSFSVKVLVAYQGAILSSAISQTNVPKLASTRNPSKGSKKAGRNPTTSGGSAALKILAATALIGGAAVGIACGASSSKCQNNGTSNSGLSCNASSLFSQLVSAFQSVANSRCSIASQSPLQDLASQYCSCIGKRLDTPALPLYALNVCLPPPNNFTPAQAAQAVCIQ